MLENRRISLIVFLAAFAATSAQAADWRLTAARHTRFGSSLAFLDLQSIRGGNGRVQFSTLTFFSRQTRNMNRVATSVTADCATMIYRFDRIELFRNQQPLSLWHSVGPAIAAPKSNLFDSISAACGMSETGAHVERIETFAAEHFRKQPRRRSTAA